MCSFFRKEEDRRCLFSPLQCSGAHLLIEVEMPFLKLSECLVFSDIVFPAPVPQVLKSCTEFIEKHGVVDGMYRLSGIASNIQKLR